MTLLEALKAGLAKLQSLQSCALLVRWNTFIHEINSTPVQQTISLIEVISEILNFNSVRKSLPSFTQVSLRLQKYNYLSCLKLHIGIVSLFRITTANFFSMPSIVLAINLLNSPVTLQRKSNYFEDTVIYQPTNYSQFKNDAL